MRWTYKLEDLSTENNVILSYQTLWQGFSAFDPQPPTADQVRQYGLYGVFQISVDFHISLSTRYPVGPGGAIAVLLPVDRAGEGVVYMDLYSHEGRLLAGRDDIFIPPTLQVTYLPHAPPYEFFVRIDANLSTASMKRFLTDDTYLLRMWYRGPGGQSHTNLFEITEATDGIWGVAGNQPSELIRFLENKEATDRTLKVGRNEPLRPGKVQLRGDLIHVVKGSSFQAQVEVRQV